MNKCKYIEIVEYATEKVVKRIDVSGKTYRQADLIDAGINRNLNHDEYFTRFKFSDVGMKTGTIKA